MCDKFDKNYKILKDYSLKNNTHEDDYFNKICDEVFFCGNVKNGDWRKLCFVSAVLEGILVSRGQTFSSMELDIKKELSENFPFNKFKNLTSYLWSQLDSKKFRLHDFYSGFAYLMLRFGSTSFTKFIKCLERFSSPYLKLYFASLINLACVLNSSINLDEFISYLLSIHPGSLDCHMIIDNILSYCGFEKDLRSTLVKFHSTFSPFLNAYSSDYPDAFVYWFNYLGSLRSVNEINTFVNKFNLYKDGYCTDK